MPLEESGRTTGASGAGAGGEGGAEGEERGVADFGVRSLAGERGAGGGEAG